MITKSLDAPIELDDAEIEAVSGGLLNFSNAFNQTAAALNSTSTANGGLGANSGATVSVAGIPINLLFG